MLTFRECCHAVLNYCPNEYAKAYAKAGLEIHPQDADAIKVQALYILSNISGWRGANATITRNALKSYGRVVK